jgi:hypothetical protein
LAVFGVLPKSSAPLEKRWYAFGAAGLMSKDQRDFTKLFFREKG